VVILLLQIAVTVLGYLFTERVRLGWHWYMGKDEINIPVC